MSGMLTDMGMLSPFTLGPSPSYLLSPSNRAIVLLYVLNQQIGLSRPERLRRPLT